MDYTGQWIDTLKHAHHRQAIRNLRDELSSDRSILAVILGGSLCHGYERPDSDIDCMVLVSDEEYEQRRKNNDIAFYSPDIAGYEGGYIDGKFHSIAYLEKVAEYGAEPARYAFKDAKIIFSKVDGLGELLQRVAAYPEEDRVNRITRFHAQLDGLRWFFGEGVKRNDRYTINWSSTSMVLFGSRMLLAYNRMLFPCHKTMTFELKRCSKLPAGIFETMEELLSSPTLESAEAYYRAIKDWREWEQAPCGWPGQFMADSELKWLERVAAVADILPEPVSIADHTGFYLQFNDIKRRSASCAPSL